MPTLVRTIQKPYRYVVTATVYTSKDGKLGLTFNSSLDVERAQLLSAAYAAVIVSLSGGRLELYERPVKIRQAT